MEDGTPGPLHSGHADRARVPIVLAGAAAWAWRILVVAAALVVVGFVVVQLYVVVVPVLLALFLAAALEPLAARLRAKGWPASLAAATVFVGSLAVLLALLAWIGTSVATQFDDLGDRLQEAVDDAKEWAQDEPLSLTRERVDKIEADIRATARNAGGGLAEKAASRAQAVGEGLGGLILLLFTLFFLLKDGHRMADWLKERVPQEQRDDAVALTSRAGGIMRQYLTATALTGLIDGVLIGIALFLLDVPLVVPLAVLTFLGGFIPIVGATIAGLIAAAVALVSNGAGTALLVVAATIAVQQIEGNLLQPLILERAVRLHPLVTVWAVGAGIVVGGLLGAFLSVPLIAIGVAVASHYYRKGEPPPAEDAPAEDAPAEDAPAEAPAPVTGEEPGDG
jgi:putative heme transporter